MEPALKYLREDTKAEEIRKRGIKIMKIRKQHMICRKSDTFIDSKEPDSFKHIGGGKHFQQRMYRQSIDRK